MKTARIHALSARILSAPQDQSGWAPPKSIEWMPAGTHTVDSMTGRYVVTADASDAERLNLQLQGALSLAAEGMASRPFIDFDHQGGQASAIPVRFFWDDGIRLEVEWTAAGEAALRGRTYSYFSPECDLGEDGHPISIPTVGPIGGLVNTPAFQEIERLAASASSKTTAEEKTSSNNEGVRMEKFMSLLCSLGVLSAADGETMTEEKAVEQLQAMKAAMDGKDKEVAEMKAKLCESEKVRADTESELATIKASQAKDLEARADSAIEDAVRLGKIDEASKASWRAMYIANESTVKAAIGGIKIAAKQHGHPNDKLPGSKSGGSQTTGEPTGIQRVAAAFAAKSARN